MTNIVHKLTNSDIQQLMSKIPFETSKLSRGMKAKQNTRELLFQYIIQTK